MTSVKEFNRIEFFHPICQCYGRKSKVDLRVSKKVKNNIQNIINRIRAKDPSGMSDLYDLYAGPLYGVISRIIDDHDLANDVLQETFVKIWSKFDQYDEDKAQLFTWMYQIARFTAIDQLRKSTNNRTAEIQEAELDVSLNSKMNIDTIDVNSELGQLEEKYRSVVYALFFEGYSQREWSKESGLPLGTIKTRLRIGLRELRKVYDKGIFVLVILIMKML